MFLILHSGLKEVVFQNQNLFPAWKKFSTGLCIIISVASLNGSA